MAVAFWIWGADPAGIRVFRSCTVPPLSIEGPPTITPLSLIDAARKLPRLVRVPLAYKNPSLVPFTRTVPAIWPLLLSDTAGTPGGLVPGATTTPRSLTAPFCHSTRWVSPLVAAHTPAIWPALLIDMASHADPLVKLGSGSPVIVPLLYRKACSTSPAAQVPPTTWPESLIPLAQLSDPESGASFPRSTIFLPFHTNASLPPLLVVDAPTTHPDRLIAEPVLKFPPRVPRSVIWPLLYENACQGCSTQVFLVLPYTGGQDGVGTSVDRYE